MVLTIMSLASCGRLDEADTRPPDTSAELLPEPTPTTTSDTDGQGDTNPPGTTAPEASPVDAVVETTAPGDTTTAPETTTAVSTTEPAPTLPDDAAVSQPDGVSATMVVPGQWSLVTDDEGPGAAYLLGAEDSGFSPNVRVTSIEEQVSIDGFVDQAAKTLEENGLEVTEQRVIEQPDGERLAHVVAQGQVEGSETLRYLTVAHRAGNTLAVAEFTATEDQWSDHLEAVQSALHTLRAIDNG